MRWWPRPRSGEASWIWFGARWWTPVVGGVGLVLILLVITARLTVLDARYDQRAVAGSDAYERLYTEVLPSDRAQDVIRDAVRPLPVDPSFVTNNTRLLLPPEVLQAVVDGALSEFVRYLLGGIDHVDTTKVLQPAVTHVEALSRRFLPGLVTTTPRLTTAGLASFDRAFARFVDALRAGKLPGAVPVLPLSKAVAGEVAATLTAGLDDEDRIALAPRVPVLLASGHLADALALVAPRYAAQHPDVAAEVTGRMSETIDTLRDPLDELRGDLAVRSIRTLRSVLPVGLWSFAVLGAVLLGIALGVGARIARASRTPVVTAVALELAGAVAVALVAGVAVLLALPDPVRALARSGTMPPSLAAIFADIDTGLRAGVLGTYLKVLGAVAVAALALGVAPVVVHLRAARDLVSPRAVLAGAAVVAAAGLLVSSLPGPTRQTTCNGAARLCVIPYDTATYLASHNAMASSDAGFINAEQDPTIVGQLDNGVRALLLDFHYWTAPAQVTQYVDRLDPTTRQALDPLVSGLGSRPGVWLCHAVCQLGASPAVETLRRVGDWLDDHRDAVVTLIIEDHTSLDDTVSTLEAAGLRRYVQPPPQPGGAWPTLGEMVRSGHRLVVFTERSDWPGGWVRNYHQLGAETRYQAASPADLSCDPGRGPVRSSLFLLNNWVSSSEPSRIEAAQVNDPATLLRRVRECQRQRGMLPTFIAVDFAQIGVPSRAVDILNRVAGPGSRT